MREKYPPRKIGPAGAEVLARRRPVLLEALKAARRFELEAPSQLAPVAAQYYRATVRMLLVPDGVGRCDPFDVELRRAGGGQSVAVDVR